MTADAYTKPEIGYATSYRGTLILKNGQVIEDGQFRFHRNGNEEGLREFFKIDLADETHFSFWSQNGVARTIAKEEFALFIPRMQG